MQNYYFILYYIYIHSVRTFLETGFPNIFIRIKIISLKTYTVLLYLILNLKTVATEGH